jgi:hypothetical protein
MVLHLKRSAAAFATLIALMCWPASAMAVTVRGTAQPPIPSGQFMSLTMTIDDMKTRFELTGPDFSWFALGFDTNTMFGYALIIEGTDGNRTAVEQNLLGIGAPGTPQATQNINIVNTIHDDPKNLTTIVIDRVNDTGDPNDPVFSPNMTQLDIIGAYSSFSSPARPIGTLSYHGVGGRGVGYIEFAVVPEPSGVSIATVYSAIALLYAARRRDSRR